MQAEVDVPHGSKAGGVVLYQRLLFSGFELTKPRDQKVSRPNRVPFFLNKNRLHMGLTTPVERPTPPVCVANSTSVCGRQRYRYNAPAVRLACTNESPALTD